jgi:hypothetical protein
MQKFSNECDYLIHLLRCTVQGLQPRELPQGLDFERVYEWGVYHHVANLAFYSVQKLNVKPEVSLYIKWQQCRDQAIVLDITQSYAAQEAREAFREGGVATVEIQGTKIKPLYPRPEWRTMSDIDFIVRPADMPKAKLILEKLGYSCHEAHRVEIHGHRLPNINIELHPEFFWEESEYRQVLHSPFETVGQDGQCDLNTVYLYNILHIAKHYFGGGCGIRRVLDVYYLNRKYGQIIDRKWIQNALERVNAAEFAASLSNLAEVWFGNAEQELPENEMASYIVNSGIHGHRPNELKHRLEKTFDSTVRFARTKYLLRRFLGVGGEMRKKYPLLRRYPILYPFCWLHRSFRALQPERRKRIRKEFKAVVKTK